MTEHAPKKQEAPTAFSRAEVVSSLQKDPEDLSMLQAYVEGREKEGRTNKDTIRLNTEIAEIYLEAGLTEAAIESFEIAAEQAWKESEDHLYTEPRGRLNKLQG